MLTVITPATQFRLTTVTRARALLGFPETDERSRSGVHRSGLQEDADYCRRPFGVETVRETFRDWNTAQGILLVRSPVTGFVSVTSDDVALLTSEYEFDADTGALYRLDGGGSRLGWSWGTSLAVQYTAGYTLPADTGTWTLPEPVERAAIQEVGAYLQSRGMRHQERGAKPCA